MSDEQKLKTASSRADVFLLERKYQEGLQASRKPAGRSPRTVFPEPCAANIILIGFARKALHDEAGARAAFLKAKSAVEERS